MTESTLQYDAKRAWKVLALNTFAFTICFACWMLNGVLVTHLRDNGIFKWDAVQMGWLIGIPVLTGALMRLPMGVLTDKFGGKPVYTLLLLFSAVPMFLVGECQEYWHFILAGLGFGMTGTGFAVGIAFSSVWFPQHRQGLALGIFGAGNAGAAVTTLAAPSMLVALTNSGADVENWRTLPKLYAALLVVTAVLFWLFTENRTPAGSAGKTLLQRLKPLKDVRVWRFGLYYFYVFGAFVALSQWLMPYFVSAYAMSLAMAGVLTASFSLPSGVVRAAGGWASDRFGARPVMYWVLAISLIAFMALSVPRMDIESPGSGVMARAAGTVTERTDDAIVITKADGETDRYPLLAKQGELVTEEERDFGNLIWPRAQTWQDPLVKVGDKVVKKQLLAEGTTHVFFQANVWVFTALVFVIGIVTGIGKAAVYKYIPEYYPNDVGVVGGMVGVIGALGGFVCPIIFGYLLDGTGIWTTCWIFLFFVTLACLGWLHRAVSRILNRHERDKAEVRAEHAAANPEAEPTPVEDRL